MLRSYELLRAATRQGVNQSLRLHNFARISVSSRGSSVSYQTKRLSTNGDLDLSSLHSGGRLFLNFKSVKYADIKINSAWTDHVVVEEILGDEKNLTSNISSGSLEESRSPLRSVQLVRRPGESNYLSLEPAPATSTEAEVGMKVSGDNAPLRLRITVPERVDIDVQGQCIDLSITNKLMGNLNVDMTGDEPVTSPSAGAVTAPSKASRGSVSLDKHRGESIVIRAPSAPFTVKTALEGTNVFVQAASFDSPLVHSKHAVVNAGNEIKVGAMYTSSFSAHADGPIHIGFMQGFAKLSSRTGPVTVGNLQGALDATVTDESTMMVNINELAAGTQSVLRALKGSIAVNFNDKINANMVSSISGLVYTPVSSEETQQEGKEEEQGDAESQVVSRSESQSATGTAATTSPPPLVSPAATPTASIDLSGLRGFHPSPSSTPVHAEGRITGAEVLPHNKTPSRKFTSGKINVRKELDELNDREALRKAFQECPGATEADAGLRMHSTHHAAPPGSAGLASDPAVPTSSSAAGGIDSSSSSNVPRITIAAAKGVTVRTRSWIDAIKEKHGVK